MRADGRTPQSTDPEPHASDDDVIVRQLVGLVGALSARGHDVRALLAGCGLRLPLGPALGERMPRTAALRIWSCAERLEGLDIGLEALDLMCADLVLDVAARTHAETDFLMLQLIFSSSTVGEAVAFLERHYHPGTGIARLMMVRAHANVSLIAELPDRDASPSAYVEYNLLLIARCLQLAAASALPGLSVELAHEGRALSRHESLAAIDVRFSAKRDAIVFPAAELVTRITSANPRLSLRLERRARELGRARGADGSLARRARQEIASALDRGTEPALDHLASRFGVSARHLTRLLGGQGTSHRAILDEVRSERAKLLLDEGASLAMIATELGYSDARALRRAFRRWFGESPSRLRALDRSSGG